MNKKLRIEWEITAACPLSCPDCSSRKVPHAADLDFERQVQVADRLAAAGVSLVSLSGGEPLAHPGWELLARRLVEGGVAVQVLTSACVWDATTARRLEEAGVGRVWLGVDGVGEAHERFRGQPGLWPRVLGAMVDLRAAGVDFGVFTTVRARTAPGIESLARWIRENEVPDWFLWAAVSGERTGAVSGDRTGAVSGDRVSAEFSRPALERVVSRWVHGTRVWFGDTWRPGEVECGAGETVLGISADGRVRGCLLQLDAPEVGYVLETELAVLAARARLQRSTRGCSACARASSDATRSTTWQRVAMIPFAALALGMGGCHSNEAESTPALPREQMQQATPPVEPESKLQAEPAGKVAPPTTVAPMRPMPNCCYSRALIRDCKCDWNRPVPTPSTNP